MLSRLLPAAGVVILMAPLAAAQEAKPEDVARVRAALPEKAPAKPVQARRLLVYNDCRGFKHSAIPLGAVAIELLGQKTGAYEAVLSSDPSVFQADSLRRFHAVCFNNTTGELFEDEGAKKALLEFVRGGKGIVGIHAATDCFYKWAEFGEMMGGYFDGHPWGAGDTVTVKVDEPEHPLTAMFGGRPFEIQDEIYQFREPYSRNRLRVLLSLDTTKTDMQKKGVKRTDGDFAISWVQKVGTGRVFYCSLGHNEAVFWNPAVLAHYLAGIQYALGDLPADAAPRVGTPGDAAAAWTPLFNGTDLAGWTCKPGSWVAEDGALARKGGGDVWTVQQFGDFVLELEFKLAEGTNSGIFFRTADLKDPVQTGIELQVLDSAGKAPDKHSCGAIYDCAAPQANAVRPAGEWNRVVLMCRGPRIQALLNEQPIINMNLDEWTTAGKNPDGSDNKFKAAYKDMARRGHIGFQDHGKPVWYRNIRIRTLDAAPTAAP